MSGKGECKRALQLEVGLPRRPGAPLIAARFSSARHGGGDVLLACEEELGALSCQLLLIVDDGDNARTTAAHALAGRYPTRVAVRVGAEDGLLHRVFAGADFVLDAGRLDGDTPYQLLCWRYGAIPIVSADSGLAEAVVDFDQRSGTGSGFVLTERTPVALLAALKRAIEAYSSPAMKALATRAMSFDLSWRAAAARYADFYRGAPIRARS